MKAYIFLGWLLLIGLMLQAQNPSAQLGQAMTAYQQQDYAKATKIYQQLLVSGYDDAGLYYNLGNCYFQQKKRGMAAWCYEKTLMRDHNHERATNNLAVLRSQLVDQLDETLEPQWWEWFLNPQWMLSSNRWTQIGLVFWWLGLLGLLVWRVGKNRVQRRVGFFAGVCLSILAILLFLPAWFSYRNVNLKKTGIVLAVEIPLKRAPETASMDARKLHEGVKVYIDDELAGWYKVHLFNGDSGWIATQGVALLQ
jgi:tetratricopeptide (TPR) repeat protein